jgi:hypothetical protein
LVSCFPKKIVCWKNPKTNENYYSWYFHTLTSEEFREFYQQFYQNEHKILPKKIFEILTPISFAVWVMDDGCYDRKSLILNTQNFSLIENKTLQKVFKRKFDLSPGINKDRDRWRLRFGGYDYQKLRNLVTPYIIPSIKYKIVPVETESARTR